MQAYEFETSLEHGMIKAPAELNFSGVKKVRVIVLMDDAITQSQGNAIEHLINNPLSISDAVPFSRDAIYD